MSFERPFEALLKPHTSYEFRVKEVATCVQYDFVIQPKEY